MSKPILRDSPGDQPAEAEAQTMSKVAGRPADAEIARVLGTTACRMALDPSGAGIAHWKHGPSHDVVEPMSHHVIVAYDGTMQRVERWTACLGNS